MNDRDIDMIQGWPKPTKHQIRVFQENNRCDVDGIIGPQTRAAIWKPEGSKYFAVRLAPYVYAHNSISSEERAFIGCYLTQSQDPNLKHLLPVHWQTLIEIVSSNWSTNLSWLTGEDGVTIGFRRYAASKARDILEDVLYEEPENPGNHYVRSLIREIEDAPNNGWPINDPAMRAALIELSTKPYWWAKQLEVAIEDWAEVLELYPEWKKGRMIALAMRALNSSPRYVSRLPQDEDRAWDRLRDKYTDGGRKENRVGRIDRIKALIKKDEEWR